MLVHAWKYLPERYRPSAEERREQSWRRGELEGVFFSTKMDRGVDLRDDLCRALVLLKYPIPHLGDPVLRTMRRQIGEEAFWRYVRDLADRELLQQCGRAVRSRGDWCQVYSPDRNVAENLEQVWRGSLTKTHYPSEAFTRNQFKKMG